MRKCMLTDKRTRVGNRVSHAKNRTKVRLKPNLQKKKVYIPSLKKFVTMKISTAAIRTIDKIGIEECCKRAGIVLE